MFSTRKSVLLIEDMINRGHQALVNKVNSFVVQLQDYVPVGYRDKAEAFKLFRRLSELHSLQSRHVPLQHNTFLDYFSCDSQIECHRGHLRVDDYYVKVLTLKDPPARRSRTCSAATGIAVGMHHRQRVQTGGELRDAEAHPEQAATLSQLQN